jgi:guanylate kinase
MDKIIIIAGPTAAGKDSAMIELLKIRPEIKPLISYTTRPIRPGETDGVEYIFIGEEEFNVLSRDNLILSGRTYTTIQNGELAVWHYGAPYPEQKGDYVTIVDHKGAKNIINKIGRKGVALNYLDAPDGYVLTFTNSRIHRVIFRR